MITVPVAGIAAAYLLFLFLPGSKQNMALAQRLKSEQDFLIESQWLDASTSVLKQKLEKTQSYIARWQKLPLHESEMATLFGQISAIAEKSGISVIRFAPLSVEIYEKLSRTPAEVECSGSFAQVMSFLGEIESLDENRSESLDENRSSPINNELSDDFQSEPKAIWIDFLQIKRSEKEGLVHCTLTITGFSGHSDNSDQANLDE